MQEESKEKEKPKVLKRIKKFFSAEFFHNPLVQWVMLITLALTLGNFIVLAYFNRPVDYPLILHYNVHFGVDVIGGWHEAYFPPMAGLLVFLINTALAYRYFCLKKRAISHILLLAAFLVQAGISIVVASFIVINY